MRPVLRRFLLQRNVSYRSSSSAHLIETLISASKSISSPTYQIPRTPFSSNCISTHSTHNFSLRQFQRALSSSPEGSSNIVLIKSGEELNSSLRKVKDESLPGMFYFTAVWCGPCKFISPVIEEQSAKYPHVKTYKVDIDQEGLESTLSNLNITAVPTLIFFQNGEKVAEIIGADVSRLKTTMEKYYK